VPEFDDHALGAAVGSLLGDSIGSLLEFRSKVSDEQIEKALQMPGGGPHNTKPGQGTDDTEMTLALAKGLAEGEGILSLDRIAHYYMYWVKTDPFDMGKTTRGGIGCLNFEKDETRYQGLAAMCTDDAKKNNITSETNGGLMRIIPLAIFCAKFEKEDDLEKA